MDTQTKELFTQQDKALHSGLVHLLATGRWEMSAKDMQAFNAVVQWTQGIPQKIEAAAASVTDDTVKEAAPKEDAAQ